jgi:hypothetical protein
MGACASPGRSAESSIPGSAPSGRHVDARSRHQPEDRLGYAGPQPVGPYGASKRLWPGSTTAGCKRCGPSPGDHPSLTNKLIAPHLRPVPVDVADDFAATALGHWHAPDLGPLPSLDLEEHGAEGDGDLHRELGRGDLHRMYPVDRTVPRVRQLVGPDPAWRRHSSWRVLRPQAGGRRRRLNSKLAGGSTLRVWRRGRDLNSRWASDP